MGYPLQLDERGRIKPLVHAFLELPRSLVRDDLDGALIVQEASMAHPDRRGLSPGDVAFLRYEPQVQSGTDAFLLLKGGGSMLRRVVIEAASRVVLHARNRNHPKKVVKKGDIQVFYRVAGRVRYSDL
jgi:SOS-response transcriptional repressor LexA